MQIHQLQVANDSVQDRLLLRIGTGSNEEIRVHITRRFLRELWPGLAAMLAGHLQARPVLNKPDAASDQTAPAGFDQPFRTDNPIYPLGSKPLLASEAVLEPAGDGVARLTLREGRERSFNLQLNAELLQALCAMLRATSEQAKWDLPLDYGPPAAIAPAAAKTLLH